MRRGRWRGRRAAVVRAAVVLAACLLLTGCGGAGAPATAPGRAATAPAADPRLVVRGHGQPVAGSLAGGARVSGILYPALPGVNTLRLGVEGPGGGGVAGHAEVTVTMPGMAMRPVRATLAVRAGRYQGAIALPMFGRYAARIVLVTRRGRRPGLLTLDVPLTLGTCCDGTRVSGV